MKKGKTHNSLFEP